MKKLFALLLALAMVFTLAACGEKPDDDDGGRRGDDSSQSDSRKDREDKADKEDKEDKNDKSGEDDRDKDQTDGRDTAPEDPAPDSSTAPNAPVQAPDAPEPPALQGPEPPAMPGGLTATPADTFHAEGLWYLCALFTIEFDSEAHTLTMDNGEARMEDIPYTFDASTGIMEWIDEGEALQLQIGVNECGLLQMVSIDGWLPGIYILAGDSNTFAPEGTWCAAVWQAETLPVLEMDPEKGLSMYSYVNGAWQPDDTVSGLPFGYLEDFGSIVVFNSEGVIIMELPITGWLNGIAFTEMGGALVTLAPAPADLLDR